MSSLRVHCRRMITGWLAFAAGEAALSGVFAWYASHVSGGRMAWSAAVAGTWLLVSLGSIRRALVIRGVMRSRLFFALIARHEAGEHPHQRRQSGG